MNILEKLGIDSESVYLNLYTIEWDHQISITWYFWDKFVWPTYSEVLKALIKTTILWDLNTFDEDVHEKSENQRFENIETIENLTGKTWKEIKDILG